MATLSSKQEMRESRWDALVREGVDRFPGAHGRIPNFEGAARAAERVSELKVWRDAGVLKCNPDSPQKPVRALALTGGKTIYMAVPKLRELRCFVELAPDELDAEQLRDASTIKGAFRVGRQVEIDEMPSIDLIVAGSVAVNKAGGRVGKGGGYSDLEYALGREFGLIHEGTPILTTVHPLQLIAGELPRRRHDIPIDYILTPEGVIETHTKLERPGGIYWELLPQEKIEAIPILGRLRQEGR